MDRRGRLIVGFGDQASTGRVVRMGLKYGQPDFEVLEPEVLEQWRKVPPAVASDCMNRTQTMRAAIKPILPDLRICGQARTASIMIGDCGPICALLETARLTEIIVVDAGGIEDTAVWGGIMTEQAVQRGLGGAVIDGAVRDVEDIQNLGFPMFCRAAVPRGPHHGFGGSIDEQVSVAGAVVSSGDIVLGNADGVAIVPLGMAHEVLARAITQLAAESNFTRRVREGERISQIFDLRNKPTK